MRIERSWSIVSLGTITSLFIAAYWLAVWTKLFPVDEIIPGYRAWFLAFPVADAWIAVWAMIAAGAAWSGSPRTCQYTLLAGSALMFLGLYAMTYGTITGLICRPTADEYIEIAIKVYTICAGAWLTWWGLRAGERSGGAEPGQAGERRCPRLAK
jgi:hypothetical protein